jgi:hypothetical protein
MIATMGSLRLATVTWLLLCWSTTAWADDRHSEPGTPPAPPPTVIIIQPPAPAPVLQPPAPPPPPAPTSRAGFYTGGAGLGFFALSPTGDHTSYRGDPALILQGRRVASVSRQFGFEFITSAVFHDWEVMGDAYEWYFTDTDDDPDRSNVGAKLLLLWPGLVLVPFFGANLGTAVGGIFYFSPKAPSFFIDAGAELQFMLRPSDDDFLVDVGFGFYGGFGIELTDRLGMSIRTSFVPPLFHAASKNDRDLRAITFAATFDFPGY